MAVLFHNAYAGIIWPPSVAVAVTHGQRRRVIAQRPPYSSKRGRTRNGACNRPTSAPAQGKDPVREARMKFQRARRVMKIDGGLETTAP